MGVAHQDDVAAMAAFVERHGLGAIPHAVDQDGDLRSHFQVVSQPNWVFVDDSGEVDQHRGALGAAQLDERIARLTGR